MNATEVNEVNQAQPPRRFQAVHAALRELRRNRPECEREVQMAMDMIFGHRPGIEAKYDALLLKLDRTYYALADRRKMLSEQAEGAPTYAIGCGFRAKAKTLGFVMNELNWMKAMNRDMIEALKQEKAVEPRHT